MQLHLCRREGDKVLLINVKKPASVPGEIITKLIKATGREELKKKSGRDSHEILAVSCVLILQLIRSFALKEDVRRHKQLPARVA